MHNDTIKVANKIISNNDLNIIFLEMHHKMEVMKNLYQEEVSKNNKLERKDQIWTLNNFEGKFKASINFYDDTRIQTENFEEFINIFTCRLHEIKYLDIAYLYNYNTKSAVEDMQFYHPSIYMYIKEDKIDISVNLTGDKMNEIYQLIKEKILNAPVKYDRVIKKKISIINKISFAKGIIPSMIALFLLVFVPTIRELYVMTYVGYPIAALLIGFVIGGTFFSKKIERLYANIAPDKKYAGYDYNRNIRIYKDDIKNFIETSEIIIGKNSNNIKNRDRIVKMEKKYGKWIPFELLALAILSIVVIIVGKILMV